MRTISLEAHGQIIGRLDQIQATLEALRIAIDSPDEQFGLQLINTAIAGIQTIVESTIEQASTALSEGTCQ